MQPTREKFATQVDSALLESLRDLAKSEGRQIQAVVEDALREHLDGKKSTKGRGREHGWPLTSKVRKGLRACMSSWPSKL